MGALGARDPPGLGSELKQSEALAQNVHYFGRIRLSAPHPQITISNLVPICL